MKKSSINRLKRCFDTDLNAISEDYFSFIKTIFTRAKDLSRIDAFDNLKELDPLIFLDALVEVLAVENRLHAKAALNALTVFCETLLLLGRSKHADVLMSRSGTGTLMIVFSPSLSLVYSPPPSVRVLIFYQLLPRYCTAVMNLLGKLKWARKSFQGVVEFLASELLNTNATVKVSKIVQSCLALLASITGSEVSDLLEPLYQHLLSSLLNRPLRSKYVDQQVRGQGLLNLSGPGDCIEAQRLGLFSFMASMSIQVLGFVLRGPLENATNDAVTPRSKGGLFPVLCQVLAFSKHPSLFRYVVLKIYSLKAAYKGLLCIFIGRGLTVTVSTSRMGCTRGVGRGYLLSNGIGSGGGYGGTVRHGCYNDTCIEGGVPYGDAELPCQLGSGGKNDSTAGGGVLVLVRYMVIADFGLAREITFQPPYTECLNTLTSLSPSCYFFISYHKCKICSEADEIYKICSVIGSSMEFTRSDGLERASKIRYQFPRVASGNPFALIPSTSKEAVNLIGALCSWDPSKSPKAVKALHHPFFQAPRGVTISLYPFGLRSLLLGCLHLKPWAHLACFYPYRYYRKNFFKDVGKVVEVRFTIREDRFAGYRHADFATSEATQKFMYTLKSHRTKNTLSGFSIQAFFRLWAFLKLSTSSIVMLCLEVWLSSFVISSICAIILLALRHVISYVFTDGEVVANAVSELTPLLAVSSSSIAFNPSFQCTVSIKSMPRLIDNSRYSQSVPVYKPNIDECLLAFLRSQFAAITVGYWSSFLLKAANVEATMGHKGSSEIRVEAFMTLRVLVLGTADQLALFLPGVVSHIGKVLHVLKTMISQDAGCMEDMDHALRALTKFLMIVLQDEANISCLDDSDIDLNMDKSLLSFLEEPRHLKKQDHNQLVEKNLIQESSQSDVNKSLHVKLRMKFAIRISSHSSALVYPSVARRQCTSANPTIADITVSIFDDETDRQTHSFQVKLGKLEDK
nr:hypothetical protein [Tanacetum cinerariifolium]